MDVSVIIVNYNTVKITQECINSVFEQTNGIDYEIILVDNASSDGSQAAFIKDKRIRLISSEVNLGFGKANNLGYRYSQGKYIFFLNSDTLLLNNAIKMIYDKMEHVDESVGCLGCILQDMAGEKVHSYADFPKTKNVIRTHVGNSILKVFNFPQWVLDSPNAMATDSTFFPVDYVTGADLFVRRSIIEKCGLFDPDFFMYYEETELQYRYNKKGYCSYIYTAPQIIHLEGSSLKSESVSKSLMKLRSSLLYLLKTQPSMSLFLFRLFLLIKSPYTFIKYNYSKSECARFLLIVINPKKYK